MTYTELKKQVEKDINDFPIFFAFNDEQFIEGKAKIGVNNNSELLSIGAGGYIKKVDRDSFHEIFINQKKRLKTFLKDKENLKNSLIYELSNHEYCITHDEREALAALGLKLGKLNSEQLEVLQQAKNEYWQQINACDDEGYEVRI